MGTVIAASDTAGLRLAGQLTIDKPVAEVHAAFDQDTAVVSFHLRNAASDPVVVTGIHTTCGCTTAELETREFAPTTEADLLVAVDLTNLAGSQRKRIAIATRRGDVSAEQDVAVVVAIAPAIVLDPPGALVWVRGVDSGTKVVAASVTPGARLLAVEQPQDGSFRVELAPGDDEAHPSIRVTPRTTDVERTTSGMAQLIVDIGSGRQRKLPLWGMIIVRNP